MSSDVIRIRTCRIAVILHGSGNSCGKIRRIGADCVIADLHARWCQAPHLSSRRHPTWPGGKAQLFPAGNANARVGPCLLAESGGGRAGVGKIGQMRRQRVGGN